MRLLGILGVVFVAAVLLAAGFGLPQSKSEVPEFIIYSLIISPFVYWSLALAMIPFAYLMGTLRDPEPFAGARARDRFEIRLGLLVNTVAVGASLLFFSPLGIGWTWHFWGWRWGSVHLAGSALAWLGFNAWRETKNEERMDAMREIQHRQRIGAQQD